MHITNHEDAVMYRSSTTTAELGVFHTHLSGSRLGSEIDEATRIEPSAEDKEFAMGLPRFYPHTKATIITRSPDRGKPYKKELYHKRSQQKK